MEIGPRIIRLGKVDGPNEFFEDINDESNHFEKEFIEYYGEEKGAWHIYGGHRLWVAPESFPETYYPDNRKVDFELIENGFVLIQEPQTENGLQLKIKITMTQDGIINLEHFVTNTSAKTIELAPWSLSVMEVGGMLAIPVNKRDSGLLHNMNISIWPYTDMNDSRVKFGTDFIMIKSTDKLDRNFKLGVSNENGYAVYFNHGNMFIKKFDKFQNGEKYPDNNVNFETYTSNLIMEIESLGKLISLNPNDTVCHSEQWQLVTDIAEPCSEQEIHKIIENYIK